MMLRQHPATDILCLGDMWPACLDRPGDCVAWVGDAEAFGLVVAHEEPRFTGTDPELVTVLWSKPPLAAGW